MFLSRTEYAAARGWSRQYVGKLAKQGRLVIGPDGKSVDVEATDSLLAASSDPGKSGVAERHQRERVEKGVYAQIAPAAAPLLPLDDRPDYQKARAYKEHYLAELSKDELLKSRGALAGRDSVDHAAFTIARTLRDLLLGLPAQLAGELIAITDPWEMERRLTEHLRRVLEDAASLIDLDTALGGTAPIPE